MKFGMRLLLLILLLTLVSTSLFAQQSTLSGRVLVYGSDSMPLIGATVAIPNLNLITTTDVNGRFEIRNIEPGEILIRVSYVGYETLDSLIRLPHAETLEIRLRAESRELEQITITEQMEPSNFAVQVPLSTVKLSAQKIQSSPRVLGEIDVIRVIQTLPGVKSESDYSGGLYVRGGRNDQNLILIDGIPVYNPWHFFGLFGAFNSDVIRSVEFNKGVFPAMYGNRLSSLLHIETVDGSESENRYNVNVGLLSTSVSLAHRFNERSSVSFGLRRTYMDPFLKIWDNSEATDGDFGERFRQSTTYYFLDSNLKYRYRLSDNHLLQVSMFYGTDKLRLESGESYDRPLGLFADNYERLFEDKRSRFGWTNVAIGARVVSTFNDYRFSQQLYTTIFNMSNSDYSSVNFSWRQRVQYNAGLQVVNKTFSEDTFYDLEKRFDQDLLDIGYNAQLSRRINENFRLDLALELVQHEFTRNGTLMENNDFSRVELTDDLPPRLTDSRTKLNRILVEDLSATNVATSLGLHLNIGKLQLYPGLRFEYFSLGDHINLLPRVNIIYRWSDQFMFTAGFGQFAQYFHAVGVESFQLPVDNWVWSEDSIQPSFATTFTSGFEINLADAGRFVIESYYRKFENLLNFDPIETFKAISGTGTLIPVYTQVTTTGIGEAYGIEIQHEIDFSRLKVQTAYTLSESKVKFDNINENRWYASRTDSRHDLGINVEWTPTQHWVIGSIFNFRTGQPITWAYSAYERVEDPLGIGSVIPGEPLIWKTRNNFRLPDYHRLDFFVSFQKAKFFKANIDYTLSVINVYNRQNIFAINPQTTFRYDENRKATIMDPRYRQIPQLPVLPMISIRVYGGSL
jgi:hypothetical protein